MKNMNVDGVGKYVKPMAISLLIGLAVTLALLLLMALMLIKGGFSSSWASIFALIAGALGSFIDGLIAARIIGKRGLFIGVISGLILCFVILIIGVIFLNSSIGFPFLLKLVTFVIASTFGGVIGVNGRR